MNIRIVPYGGPPMSIEEFAELHGLELVVRERERAHWGNDERTRWFAEFEDFSIQIATGECSGYGNGRNPLEAIFAYVENIKGATLVNGDRTKAIQVPAGLR